MNDLLQLAIEKHGGMDRWNRVESLELTFTVSGALFEIKGFPEHMTTRLLVPVDHQQTIMHPYGKADQIGVFTPDKVWIEAADGSILDSRDNPRDAFEGHVRATPWDQLHRLYFLGYAMWNYLTTPFIFTREGFVVEELAEHQEDNEVWRVMNVHYPTGFATHCSPQKHYFDLDGNLKRIDYNTDVAGGVATHYCYDPKDFGGLIVPTRRRVVQRFPAGPKINGRSTVFLDYLSLKVNDH